MLCRMTPVMLCRMTPVMLCRMTPVMQQSCCTVPWSAYLCITHNKVPPNVQAAHVSVASL